MKKGTDFELLVKAIYEEILSLDEIENTVIEHDLKILGKSGVSHQIDVYWEFVHAGIKHRVAVECKDYKAKVSIGKIRDFNDALNDIGNVKGIFVTSSTYQSGAIDYAKHCGISLMCVSEPSEDDLKSIDGVRKLVVNSNALCISNVRMQPYLDAVWVLENTNLTAESSFTIDGMTDEIKVLDKDYNLLGTILDFENKLPRKPENTMGLSHEFKFDDAYLYAPNTTYLPLKLKRLTFDYDTITHTARSETHFEHIAQAIIRDVVNGNCHFYKQGIEITEY
ncbi:restriction endonuclease [Vibrio cholerae]|uniref:restriction endonuclease n=1 Tax=Vibrio cholerae TaxID=666 RepID=UPI00068DB5D3|nr:restriction endonuclease [Vibrio cholerae]